MKEIDYQRNKINKKNSYSNNKKYYKLVPVYCTGLLSLL